MIMRFTPRVKIIVLTLALIFYFAVVIITYDIIQLASFMFMFLPAVAAAALYGRRAGLLMPLGLTALTMFFLVIRDYPDSAMLMKFLGGSALTVLMAYAVGWLRDMYMLLMDELDYKQKLHEELENQMAELQKAQSELKTLSGLLPICSSCKRIRDDMGYWFQIEEYISDRTEAQFSHGLCPTCMKKYYNDDEE
ncbi:MAG: hypothetical protein ACLFQX_00255 [Candidatus Kapaibacterium sp.]